MVDIKDRVETLLLKIAAAAPVMLCTIVIFALPPAAVASGSIQLPRTGITVSVPDGWEVSEFGDGTRFLHTGDDGVFILRDENESPAEAFSSYSGDFNFSGLKFTHLDQLYEDESGLSAFGQVEFDSSIFTALYVVSFPVADKSLSVMVPMDAAELDQLQTGDVVVANIVDQVLRSARLDLPGERTPVASDTFNGTPEWDETSRIVKVDPWGLAFVLPEPLQQNTDWDLWNSSLPLFISTDPSDETFLAVYVWPMEASVEESLMALKESEILLDDNNGYRFRATSSRPINVKGESISFTMGVFSGEDVDAEGIPVEMYPAMTYVRPLGDAGSFAVLSIFNSEERAAIFNDLDNLSEVSVNASVVGDKRYKTFHRVSIELLNSLQRYSGEPAVDSESVEVSESTVVSESSMVSESAGVGEVSEAAEVPEAPEVAEAPEIPETPEVPEPPEVPEIPVKVPAGDMELSEPTLNGQLPTSLALHEFECRAGIDVLTLNADQSVSVTLRDNRQLTGSYVIDSNRIVLDGMRSVEHYSSGALVFALTLESDDTREQINCRLINHGVGDSAGSQFQTCNSGGRRGSFHEQVSVAADSKRARYHSRGKSSGRSENSTASGIYVYNEDSKELSIAVWDGEWDTPDVLKGRVDSDCSTEGSLCGFFNHRSCR